MSIRARAAVGSAVLAALLVPLGCSSDAPRRGDGRAPAVAARHAATPVLDAPAARPLIDVTPYERGAFLEMAMQPAVTVAHRTAVLERWDRDPTFGVAGSPTPEDLRRLGEAMTRWTLITHRHLTLDPTTPAVMIHFVPREQFAAVLGLRRVDPGAVGLSRVSFEPGRRGTITGGIVVIDSDDDQVTRNRTIGHELGHAMGLQHSTCPSSLMDGSSEADRSVRWSPSGLDTRMGSLLYDPRLEPGLTLAAVDARLAPTAVDGATCAPVDLELVRAAGTGRHYFCVRSADRVRPCTSNVSVEPTLPLRHPDAWTDGSSLRATPPG